MTGAVDSMTVRVFHTLSVHAGDADFVVCCCPSPLGANSDRNAAFPPWHTTEPAGADFMLEALPPKADAEPSNKM